MKIHYNSSVEFSCSVVSNSFWPHGLQHIRPPCPSPTPRAYSDSCPLSRWCHPTVSSSVVPFSSHLQCFPASWSFPMIFSLCIRWLKYWSFSYSISPSSEYSGLISFRLDWSLRAEILRYGQGTDGSWGMEKEGLGALWLLFSQWSRKEGHRQSGLGQDLMRMMKVYNGHFWVWRSGWLEKTKRVAGQVWKPRRGCRP